MNTLNVKRLSVKDVRAADIPAQMRLDGIAYQKLGHAPWAKDYQYCPHAEFAIAYVDEAILLHFRVAEKAVRAVAKADDENIWEDSCVEFFVSPVDDNTYYNIECNCAGQLLVGGGNVKPDRRRSSLSVMHAIDRWASLGRTPFDTREGQTAWEVALRIPLSTFFLHDVKTLAGTAMRANFYKCGDMLPSPHFLSWNDIDCATPNFHRPDCFGLISFQ